MRVTLRGAFGNFKLQSLPFMAFLHVFGNLKLLENMAILSIIKESYAEAGEEIKQLMRHPTLPLDPTSVG
jgi:hypothetical protein